MVTPFAAMSASVTPSGLPASRVRAWRCRCEIPFMCGNLPTGFPGTFSGKIVSVKYLINRRKCSLALLHPELIHAGKGRRVLGLELVPSIKVSHGDVRRKTRAVGCADRPGEAEEGEAMRA